MTQSLEKKKSKMREKLVPQDPSMDKVLPSEQATMPNYSLPQAIQKGIIGNVLVLKKKDEEEVSNCGANAQGGGGFQAGNDCASGGDGDSGGEGGAEKKPEGESRQEGSPQPDDSGQQGQEGQSQAETNQDVRDITSLFDAQDNETLAPVDNPHVINPNDDPNGDGITDNSRVGVGAMDVPPPPDKIPRMPNLTPDERAVENNFAKSFEGDPDGLTDQYYNAVTSREFNPKKPLDHKVFNTDDAKELSGDYAASLDAKARYNLAVHQTANAVAKRAFVKRLDEMAKSGESEVLITMGGVAAGKGYATGQEFNDIADRFGAVWDSAGEQNGTEMPWLQEELSKRGMRGTYVFVHTDPLNAKFSGWNAALKRAKEKGRTVDARLFAESYTIGAANFEKFASKHAGDGDFIILDNRGEKAKALSSIPKEDIPDVDTLHLKAMEIAQKNSPTPSIKRGATLGTRVFSKRND